MKEPRPSNEHRPPFVRTWRARGETRAALVIAHDFRSHSARYEQFAGLLSSSGIACHALDLRGHGRSPGPRFGVRRFSDYVDDIDAVRSAIRASDPSVPLFVLGHGAGGVAASLHALEHQKDLAGLICESVALDLATSASVLRAIRALALTTPGMPTLRGQSARTVVALLHAIRGLRASLAQLSLPLLVLHGTADRVTLASGSEYLHEHAGSGDKTLQIFEGYYHDLINDQRHEHVVERIRQWMEARLNADHRPRIGIEFINADP